MSCFALHHAHRPPALLCRCIVLNSPPEPAPRALHTLKLSAVQFLVPSARSSSLPTALTNNTCRMMCLSLGGSFWMNALHYSLLEYLLKILLFRYSSSQPVRPFLLTLFYQKGSKKSTDFLEDSDEILLKDFERDFCGE